MTSNWVSNGDTQYKLCGLDEEKLLLSRIQAASSTQKEFYILDIGAGKFQWVEHMVKQINQCEKIQGITVHIIGVRAERSLEPTEVQIDKCVLHRLGGFNAENLLKECASRGLSLADRVDIIVSRLCFPHLADPVRTFIQAYTLLKPKAGIMAVDGFFYGIEGESNAVRSSRRMVALLFRLNAQFLWKEYEHPNALDHFAIVRPEGEIPTLPMRYGDWKEAKFQNWEPVYTHYGITHFHLDAKEPEGTEQHPPREYGGNSSTLYDQLTPHMTTAPLHFEMIDRKNF